MNPTGKKIEEIRTDTSQGVGGYETPRNFDIVVENQDLIYKKLLELQNNQFTQSELDILWSTFEAHHDIALGEDKKLHSYKEEFINDTQEELENLANKLYRITFGEEVK